jgi:protein required for attachment to host cells
MLLPHGSVVALVDGAKLELYRNSGNEAVPALSLLDAPKLDQHNKDSGARHVSSSANPTGHQLDEDSHAAAVADWLNQQVLGHKIEHLVVIASPRTLGEMRRHYHKQLEAALIGELHKDLNGRSAPEIMEALRSK